MLIDEVFTFFMAGMETIQVSTTNLIYYVNRDKEIQKKFLAEILPPIEKVKDDILNKLEYDTVMEFDYL